MLYFLDMDYMPQNKNLNKIIAATEIYHFCYRYLLFKDIYEYAYHTVVVSVAGS